MNCKTRTKHNSRQGVTLLFTISMIVLFLLMGTTFVVVANDYFKTAARRSRLNAFRVDAAALLDRAFADAYRGPSLNDVHSPLRGLDLLTDVYGFGIRGTLSGTANTTILGSNLVTLNITDLFTETLRNSTASSIIFNIDTNGNPVYVDGIFNGRVITFISGEAQGYSTRIVSNLATDTDGDGTLDQLQFVVARDNTGIVWSRVAAGDEYIINGREYSGYGGGALTGGFDPDAVEMARLGPGSLRPIQTGVMRSDLTDSSTGYLANSQSTNEPYDAPDQFNLLLSGRDGGAATVGGILGNIIPSFHRDRLYSDQSPGTSVADIRQLTIRPFYLDADSNGIPDAGSTANANFEYNFINETTGDLANAINSAGGLDVDNDFDGTNDSVWIDIGLPIQTDDEGRSFRPLVAYHIVDLDNRLNLNAHGTQADAAIGASELYGIGVGPADISLRIVAGTDYENLLDVRYGNTDNSPGNTANSLTQGQKLFGHPVSPQYLGGLFGSALPFLAESTLVRPVTAGPDELPYFVRTTTNLTSDAKLTVNPYASSFALGGGVGDFHFQPAELESIYRANDTDGNLIGGRLFDDFSTIRNSASKVTTDSFEVAVPANTRSVIELLRERVRTEVGNTDMNAVVREFLTGNIDPHNRIISKEMILGGRFNLNRFLGNGIDDDFDGVIDDAQELATTVQRTTGSGQPEQQQFGNTSFDLDNRDGIAGDGLAKVVMARQLYALALLVGGESVTNPTNWSSTYPTKSMPSTIPGTATDRTGTSANEAYRKAVAQWAVNIVDYRDPDSIMTVFEYDVNPFNDPRIPGNVVDGDPTTDEGGERGIVYGLERPEILMTETIAVHDRQNQDVATEVDGNMDNSDVAGETTGGGDMDWDSARIPQTAAYIELYHPWAQPWGDASRQQELHRELTNDPSIVPDGVHLDKLAPGDTPVWRIVAVRGPDATDPNQPVRSIYFADPSNSDAPGIPGDSFYPSGSVGPVVPGGYAVVGSSGNVAGRDMFTFGRLTSIVGDNAPTAAEIDMTRSIELTAAGVVVRGPTPGEDMMRPCRTIVIDREMGSAAARGLSLSDPNNGYQITGGSDNESDGVRLTDGAFPPMNQARDTPYDADLPLGAAANHDADDIDAIWTNGVKKDSNYQFRVLHLQRLADPNSLFDADANPYVTVDIANVDLLAFNGLTNNPDNGMTTENGFRDPMDPTSERRVMPADTQMGGIERGEKLAGDATDNGLTGRQVARRSLFRFGDERKDFTTDVAHVPLDPANPDPVDHNFSYSFDNSADPTYPERLETLGGRNDAYNDNTTPFGWLAWGNRPYANHMELANVPMLSAEGLIRHFGESEEESQMVEGSNITIGTQATSDAAFSFFFGDDQFAHLPGFGGVLRDGQFEPNRFDILLDYIEVPNRFVGSETWLSGNVTGTTPSAPNALLCNLHAPFHSIPNFRYPGKVNINNIYEADVWNAVTGGFGATDFATFRASRSAVSGPTDIAGVFTSTEGAEFVETGAAASRLKKGQDKSLFRRSGTAKAFDGDNESVPEGTTDIETAATFRNELRTRVGGLTTTRSSVYGFWITIGYFEVDEFDRVGAEIGSDDGTVRRDRAFYMVDRSIPVACEPGKNHNVDQAVLVRTIIE